jgi:hypothetical protein
MRRTPTYAKMNNTSRLGDEKSIQLNETKAKQQSQNETPLLSLAMLRRFITDIDILNIKQTVDGAC